MSIQKNRMELLVNATNNSIKRIKSGTDPVFEISNLINLVQEISEMNASDFFKQNNDLPEIKSKNYYYNLSNLLELMVNIFAIEMVEDSKKLKKIVDILK
jgi:hypothetical protein